MTNPLEIYEQLEGMMHDAIEANTDRAIKDYLIELHGSDGITFADIQEFRLRHNLTTSSTKGTK